MQLNRDITMSELTKSFRNMKNNKSPGTGGFSSDFNVFWKKWYFWYAISELYLQHRRFIFNSKRKCIIILCRRKTNPGKYQLTTGQYVY